MNKYLAALLLAASALSLHGCNSRPEGNLDQTAHLGEDATPSWRL